MLEDRTNLNLGQELANRLGFAPVKMREGAVHPDAPACNTSSKQQNSVCSSITRTTQKFSLNFTPILAHDLLKATHLKKGYKNKTYP